MQAPPKFSSFVRKSASSAATSQQASDAGDPRGHSEYRADYRPHYRRHKERHRPRGNGADTEKALRTRHASPAHTSYSPSNNLEQSSLLGNDLCFVDTKGDGGNTKYGSSDKASIPAYHSSPERRAIGYWEVRPLPGKNLLSTLSRDEKTLLRRDEPQLKLMSEAVEFQDVERDFISLASGTKRRRLGNQDLHFRRSVEHEEIGSDSGRSSGDAAQAEPSTRLSSEDGHELLEVKGENARLLRKLQAQPSDAQAWQEYIDHQERWMAISHSYQGSKVAFSRAVADLRISLYTDALSKLGETHPAQASFSLKLLEEGEKVWEWTKLMAKWKDTVSRGADSLKLQTGYLDSIQCYNYDFDRCRQQYKQLLRWIDVHVRADQADHAENQIYALLRFTSMAYDAGFAELAQNIWQGLLELNLGLVSGGTHAQRLQRVEDLWDSEASRIGDPAERMSRNSTVAIVTCERSLSDPIERQSAKSWADQEITLFRHRLGGGSDPNEMEDPFSIIFFQDIEPFLFTIPSNRSLLLVDGFLTFSGLPLLSTDVPSPSSRWQVDPFVHRPLRRASGDAEVPDESLTLESTPRALFSRHVHCWKTDHPAFVRRVLVDLLHKLQDRPQLIALAEYYLAFIAHEFPDEAKAEAKKILKRFPVSLRLYHAMGLIEVLLGNSQAADQILNSAMDMCRKLPETSREHEALLRLSWIWQAVDEQDSRKAMRRLQDISQGAPAVEKLIHKRNHASHHGRYYEACAYSEILALERYLAHDFDLPSALAAFRHELDYLTSSAGSSPFGLELLHQARALLVQHHVRHFKHFSPIQIRYPLRESALQFPANTLLLQLYMQNEARFIVDDRTRSSTRDVVLSQDEPSLVSYLAYLQREIRLIGRFGATQHSIRSHFEQALSSRHGKRSQALWLEYFFFELHVANDLKRTKTAYYRGLSSVPWSKQFALLAFEHLAGVFDEEEFREIHGLMQERGMRLLAEYS